MKRIPLLLTFLVLFVTPVFAKVNVVATLPWIGSIAEEIGKDKIDLTILVKPNQDPHMIEAKPSMIVAARKATIIMYNGLDLEIGYLPVLIESSRNPKIQPGEIGNFDCSKFITPIDKPLSVDRSMGDVRPLGNPHYHYSPSRVLRIAEGMTEVLSEIDPENKIFYTDSLVTFWERLKERLKIWDSKPLQGKRFVAFHKLFEYLAAEFGFQFIGYIEPKPGIPPSASHIEKLIEEMKKSKPAAILTTAYAGTKEADFISQKTGVKVVVLPNDVDTIGFKQDWFSFMDQVLSSLE